jgi:hypothetical protein
MTEVATALAARQQRASRRRAKVLSDDEPAGVAAGRGVRDTRPSRITAAPRAPKSPKRSGGATKFGSSFQFKTYDRAPTGALVAEFMGAALIIVLALFTETATKGYAATISKVMMRLTALTMVFFVLFLLQGSKRGAQAAIWLGLLIVIGVIFTAAQEKVFTTTADEVSGKGTGVTLTSKGRLADGSGSGLDVPPEPVGVTLPSE